MCRMPYLVLHHGFLTIESDNNINTMIIGEYPEPEAIKLLSISTQLCMKFQLLIKARILKNKDFFFNF